jgi:hypothetical protein
MKFISHQLSRCVVGSLSSSHIMPEDQMQCDISLLTIWRTIRRAGFTIKRYVTKLSFSVDYADAHCGCHTLGTYEPELLVFIDESAVDFCTACRKAWAICSQNGPEDDTLEPVMNLTNAHQVICDFKSWGWASEGVDYLLHQKQKSKVTKRQLLLNLALPMFHTQLSLPGKKCCVVCCLTLGQLTTLHNIACIMQHKYVSLCSIMLWWQTLHR